MFKVRANSAAGTERELVVSARDGNQAGDRAAAQLKKETGEHWFPFSVEPI